MKLLEVMEFQLICTALNMPANLENEAVAKDWKKSVSVPISKEGNAQKCSKYCTIALISHASKVVLKILQARLQFKLDLEKAEEQDIKLLTSFG